MRGRPYTIMSIWSTPKLNGYRMAAVRKQIKQERMEAEAAHRGWVRFMENMRSETEPVRKEWVR